ncbi:SA1320 family protein [Gemella sanguinis]
MSNYTELISSTAHASNLAYGFETARVDEYGDDKVVVEAQRLRDYNIPSNMEYLEDMYDPKTGTSGTAFRNKDTGEVILAYTGTNLSFRPEVFKDIGTDFYEVLTAGGDHYKPAYEFYERVRAKYGNNIILTGHSLGGNIAQRVALEYNVPKTVVYNSAPLYLNEIPKESVSYDKEALKAEGRRRIKEGYEEQEKIKELEKKYTGETIRIRSESDVVSAAGGKNLGIEYTIKNGGGHPMITLVDSEVGMTEIEKITRHMYKNVVTLDVNKDGITDIRLNKLDLSAKNLFSGNGEYIPVKGEKIQLNPATLRNIANNLRSRVLSDLEFIKKINGLCIEKNQKTRFDFEKRKDHAADRLKREFNNAGVPQVLDNLRDSVGQIIRSKSVLEGVEKTPRLKLGEIPSDERPYVGDKDLFGMHRYNVDLYDLAGSVRVLLEQCNKEETHKITDFFQGRPTIIKAWREIEEHTKKLLDESEKTLEGDGLRTGKEDGISQSLTTVLDVAEKNIGELGKVVSNTAEMFQSLADSFETQDNWIGDNLKNGKFVGSLPERKIPRNYRQYLSRDGIFDDVKDVLHAFERQVDKRSGEFSKRISELFNESFGNFEGGLENWYGSTVWFEKHILQVSQNSKLDVEVEKRNEDNKGKKRYWGKLIRLYPESIKNLIITAESTIIPAKRKIGQAIETSKAVKNNLSSLEPQVKEIVKESVYKDLELYEIVSSQKLIAQISNKIVQELNYVLKYINSEGMSGEAVTAIRFKVRDSEKSFNYYGRFIGDCFGN